MAAESDRSKGQTRPILRGASITKSHEFLTAPGCSNLARSFVFNTSRFGMGFAMSEAQFWFGIEEEKQND